MRGWLRTGLAAALLGSTALASADALPLGGISTAGPPPDALTTLLASVTCNPCWGNATGTTTPLYSGPLAAAIAGFSGPTSVMSTWSGGVLDTTNDRLIVWGGGHTDYTGNEVYAFSLPSLSWSIILGPSNPAGMSGTSGVMPDGNPSSRHTYDGLAFLPVQHKMVTLSGAVATSGDASSSWLFDVNADSWVQTSTQPSVNGQCCGNDLAFDSGTGHAFGSNNLINNMVEYNPATDTWSTFGANNPLGSGATSVMGVVDPVDEIMLFIGGGNLSYVNLTGGSKGAITTPTVTGDATLKNANGPGVVWDPNRHLFVGWMGDAKVYEITPNIGGTWTSAVVNPNASNTVVPTCQDANGNCTGNPGHQTNGTWGRWQYDATHGGFFFGVNSTSDDVFVYKR